MTYSPATYPFTASVFVPASQARASIDKVVWAYQGR